MKKSIYIYICSIFKYINLIGNTVIGIKFLYWMDVFKINLDNNHNRIHFNFFKKIVYLISNLINNTNQLPKPKKRKCYSAA